MKKLCNIVTALMAIVAMVACSTDDTYTQTQPEQQAEPLAITFSPYVGRSVTRATIQDENSLRKNGIALFTMATDGKYDPTATKNNTFNPGFYCDDNNWSQNTKLLYDSNNSKWKYTYANQDSTLYWPVNPNIYYSFMAVYPSYPVDSLKTIDGSNLAEDNHHFIQYYFNPKVEGIDVMRSKNDLSNMQCRWTTHAVDQQTGQQETSTITTVADDEDAFTANHDIYLRMIHPTARIALSLTSTAMLNTEFYDKTITNGTAKSLANVQVQEVVLLGDNQWDRTNPGNFPTGVFTKKALLNLAGKVKGKAGDPDDSYTITDEEKWGKLWVPDATAGKSYFAYNKLYNGAFAENYSSDTEHTTADTGRKMWIPSDKESTHGLIEGSATIAGGAVSNATVNSIGSGKDNYLFIVPQDFSKDDGDKLYCYVKYSVAYGGVLKADTYEGYVQIKKNFVAGGAYVIRIDINTNVAAPVPITYSVVEEPRADEEKVPATL